MAWAHPQRAIRGAVALVLAAALAACGGAEDPDAGAPDTDTVQADAADRVFRPAVEVRLRPAGRSHFPWLPACEAPPNPLTDITAVQGPGETSPLLGQAVTVRGVVIGDFQDDAQLRGFFIQQPVPDHDPATSEGLFIFAPGAIDVKEGDYVQVSGVVVEYPDTAAAANRVTQIANPSALTVCGPGPRILPRRVTLPLGSAADLERYENMRVILPQPLTVTEHQRPGPLWRDPAVRGRAALPPQQRHRRTHAGADGLVHAGAG